MKTVNKNKISGNEANSDEESSAFVSAPKMNSDWKHQWSYSMDGASGDHKHINMLYLVRN